MSGKAKATKSIADKKQPKKPQRIQQTRPAWAEKYSVSLDINATFEIPQIGAVIKPKDLSLEQADQCLAKGCDWIKQR